MPSVQTDSNTQDLPLAQVNNVGTSEVLSALVVLSGLLTLLFGQDFGVRDNADQWAALMVGMATVGTSIARAIKHHGVVQANAHVLTNSNSSSAPALNVPVQTDNGTYPEDGPQDDLSQDPGVTYDQS